MKNLIVNADDLGWTEGVNQGIAEGHRSGLITSTSLLANGPAFESAVAIAGKNPELGVGVHLNLSDGRPTASADQVRSLLNDSGEMKHAPQELLLRIASRRLVLDEAEREWNAQIEKVRSAGIHPTHLDGHKHVHMFPGLFEVAVRLAAKHHIRAIRIAREDSKLRALLASGGEQNSGTVWKQGVRARALKLLGSGARKLAEQSGIGTCDYFCGLAQTGVWRKAGVLRLLENLPEGTTELMCHPGYADEELRRSPTRLQDSRQTELAILTDAAVRKVVATQGIRLISYVIMGELG